MGAGQETTILRGTVEGDPAHTNVVERGVVSGANNAALSYLSVEHTGGGVEDFDLAPDLGRLPPSADRARDARGDGGVGALLELPGGRLDFCPGCRDSSRDGFRLPCYRLNALRAAFSVRSPERSPGDREADPPPRAPTLRCE